MTLCGHRFQGRDATDWILSTSASCLDGSTTASQILHELFKRHCNSAGDKDTRKMQKHAASKAQQLKTYEFDDVKEANENLIVKKIPGNYGFEDFDESQHLNGCPMKWLYNKKLSEKNKRYKVGKICYKKLAKKEENKKEKRQNVRDKTPMEVKIHKINLIEKYTTNYEENYTTYQSLFVKKPENEKEGELESRRRKLAAKLNWKLHDETADESSLPSAELKCNYLPPRPMLGLKPFLSVLLAPNQTIKCCSLTELTRNSTRKERVPSSLSIQSLDLPDFPPPNSHPRSTNTSRWGSKSSRLSKKLQVPNQITINLGRNEKGGFLQNAEYKIVGSNPTIKKLNDKPKQTKSLSALFYELKDKSNFRNESEEERFHHLMKDLTMESQFKIKRFFNMSAENSPGEVQVKAPQVRDKQEATSMKRLNLVCGKISSPLAKVEICRK